MWVTPDSLSDCPGWARYIKIKSVFHDLNLHVSETQTLAQWGITHNNSKYNKFQVNKVFSLNENGKICWLINDNKLTLLPDAFKQLLKLINNHDAMLWGYTNGFLIDCGFQMHGPCHWLPICFALLAVGSENIAGRGQSSLWGLCFFPEEMKRKLFDLASWSSITVLPNSEGEK